VTTFQDYLVLDVPDRKWSLGLTGTVLEERQRCVENYIRERMEQVTGLRKFANSCTYSVTTETVGLSQESGSEIMDDAVNHPEHYTKHPSGVECIQVTEHMGFCLGNAVKYLWRADLKGDAIVDLEKAIWYINREINKRKLAEDDV